MAHTVRVLVLVLVSSLLAACAAPPPPARPTASGGYAFSVTVQPHHGGSILTVRVDPPDPSDPEQRATAQRLAAELLEAYQAQMAPPAPTEADAP